MKFNLDALRSWRRAVHKKLIPLEEESAKKDREHIKILKNKLDEILNNQHENSEKYNLAAEINKDIFQNERSLWKKEMNILIWKNYSFSHYIINILNQRFPQR